MWKVAIVQPVTEGFGFNITTETSLPLVSFAYATRAEAEAAATHAQAAVEKAVSVVPVFNPQPRRRWWAVLEGRLSATVRDRQAGRRNRQLRRPKRKTPPKDWTGSLTK